MKSARAFSFGLYPLNFRRELRLALLAAMETCWTFSVLVFVAALIQVPAFSSPLPLFSAYWMALIVGRELPRRKERWFLLQAVAILIAVMVVLVIVRVEMYAQYRWFDFSWLQQYLRAIFFAEGFGRAIYITLPVLYVFIRGLGFGARPLTLWFVGFQFRWGVVIFFVLMLAAAIYRPVDVSLWIFAYFFLSLLSISLARLDEVGSDLHYGPRWTITLLSGVALVLFLGLFLLQFFTLDTATWLLGLLSPLWIVAGFILLLIAIPASYIASFLAEILRPLFANLSSLFRGVSQVLPQFNPKDVDDLASFFAPLAFLVHILQIAGVLIIVLAIGYLIARTLNRRMQKSEQDAYEREALESEDETVRARRAFLPQKKPLRRRARQIGAETIRRIYAAMTARAEETGLPRKVAETPYEFSPRLRSAWKDESDDVDAITEAYVAVHYAEHEATDEEVSRVKEAWERVKRETENVKRKT